MEKGPFDAMPEIEILGSRGEGVQGLLELLEVLKKERILMPRVQVARGRRKQRSKSSLPGDE